jgi:2-haloacid dehalogenase
MLESAVRNAKIENLLDEVISVERCKVFKPSSKVYDLVKDAFNVNKNEVAFFSSNAWDMHAAANYGFKTIWVNRFNGKLERLPGKPKAIVKNLDGIVQIL